MTPSSGRLFASRKNILRCEALHSIDLPFELTGHGGDQWRGIHAAIPHQFATQRRYLAQDPRSFHHAGSDPAGDRGRGDFRCRPGIGRRAPAGRDYDRRAGHGASRLPATGRNVRQPKGSLPAQAMVSRAGNKAVARCISGRAARGLPAEFRRRNRGALQDEYLRQSKTPLAAAARAELSRFADFPAICLAPV